MSAKVRLRRVKLLTLDKAMPKWKELHVPVHSDGYVCTLPEGECHLPHTIMIGIYKLKHIENQKQTKNGTERSKNE
jgi:hypothetical protein